MVSPPSTSPTACSRHRYRGSHSTMGTWRRRKAIFWFLSTSIGNKLSGILASLWDTYEDKADFFLVNFGLLMGATLIMFVMLRWLNRIIPEKK